MMTDYGYLPFNVKNEARGQAVHVIIEGEIDMASAPVLESWLRLAEGNGASAIVADLNAVTFMDGSGLRVFLGAAERSSRVRRTFAIRGASRAVRRVFAVTATTHLLSDPDLTYGPQILGAGRGLHLQMEGAPRIAVARDSQQRVRRMKHRKD